MYNVQRKGRKETSDVAMTMFISIELTFRMVEQTMELNKVKEQDGLQQ